MANFLSQRSEYNKPVDTIDHATERAVLAAKEGKYQQGLAAIDSSLADLGRIDGMLIKDTDRQYLADKVKSLIDTVNNSGKLDLSNSGVTRNIQNQIKSALDSRVISDVSQSNTYKTFNASVAEKRQSKPDTFSEGNYQDALERGNTKEWLADTTGTVKLGNLSYSDYVDVATIQDKKAADYAKERGLKDQFIGRSSDAYQTTDKYGVTVTREEIEDYLSSTLDEKTKNQLYIDTRQSIGKLKDEDFNTFMSASQNQDNESLRSEIAKAKAGRDAVTEDRKAQYDSAIKDAEKRLDAGELRQKNGVYDRSEMYDAYRKGKMRDIASNHDVDIITKIETSDMPFEIMKFKTETELKMQELELKKKANSIAQNGSLGTMTETPLPVVEKESTKLQEQQQATYKSDQALDAYLKENNQEYNKMTPQQQWDYKLHLNPNNPLATGSTTTLKNLVNTFQEAQGGYAKIVKEANKNITTDAEISYNNLIGGADIDLGNLKTTMPLTASLIQTKKNFSSLTNEEKLGITTEFASSYLQYGKDLNDDVRTVYEKVVISNKASIQKYGTTKAKEVSALLKEAGTEEVGGFFRTNWDLFKGFAGNTIGKAATAVIRDTTYPFRSLLYGETEADKSYKESEESSKQYTNYADWAKSQQRKSIRDFWGGEDTNITELEARDTKDGKDVLERFNTSASRIKTSIDEIAGSYQENRKTGQAFTFSTADKSQATIALKLRAAVLTSEDKPAIPAGTNDYTVAREGSGYRISFVSGTGEKAAYSSAFVAKLPPEVAGMYDESVQSWTNNPNNPNIRLKDIEMSPYVSPSRRNQDIKNLINNKDLSAEAKNMMATNPSQTVFATNPELRENIQKKYGADFYSKNTEGINAILNNKYVGIPYISGGNFYMKIQYTEDGEEKEYSEQQSIGTEKDDHAFHLAYMEIKQKLRSEKIDNLYTAQ